MSRRQIRIWSTVLRLAPSIHKTPKRCRISAGPPSATLVQHRPNKKLKSRVGLCRAISILFNIVALNTMFLLYINDSPLCTRFSKVALFADDLKSSKRILSRQSCIELRSDIDSMYKWSQLWQMDFNDIKSYIISFTRSKNPILFDYITNGVPLQRVDKIRDLGVIITSSLSWNNHIDNIISKTARISGLIKRTLG